MTTALRPPSSGPARADHPPPPRPAVRSLGRVDAVAIGLVSVVALGAVLRLWALGRSKLNYDESFTAMAGRLPVGRLFTFLTAHDSHPPLDYLLHAPFARAGANEFWFRLPSALCSIGALVLLSVWLRPRGRVAVLATALVALSAFQIAHGRDARMYAELEVLGVGIALLTDRWLRAPARHHAPLLGALVLAGLYTHVSMFLLAAGLLTVAGVRRDREAWRWRAAIALPVVIWAVTWGPHFLVQARGGHSTWIPSTTVSTFTTAIAHAVTLRTGLLVAGVIVAVAAGAVVLCQRDQTLGRVWIGCFAVPVGIAAVAGCFEPVVLDRTFTLMAWAPAVAIAFLLDALLTRRWAWSGLAVAAVAGVLLLPDAWSVATARTGPTTPLRALDRRVRPGDVVAVRPASKAPELQWSLAVRNRLAGRPVEVAGLPRTFALRMGDAAPTGRVWYLNWRAHRWHLPAPTTPGCAAAWKWGGTRINCLTGQRVEANDA